MFHDIQATFTRKCKYKKYFMLVILIKKSKKGKYSEWRCKWNNVHNTELISIQSYESG